MQFSPTVRTVLTALVAALAVVAVALPTLGAPLWVGVILGALTAGLGAVGIVPPQTGGTQEGGIKAQLSSPPAVETPGPGDGVIRDTQPVVNNTTFVNTDEEWSSKTERANYGERKHGSEQDGLF
jgi:hypothetical protein